MIRKLILLLVAVGMVSCGQVDPDAHKPIGTQYGRTDGWYRAEADDDWHMVVDGSETGLYIDSSGNIVTSNDLNVSGTTTLSGVSTVTAALDDDKIWFGTSEDGYIEYDVAVQGVDTMVLGVPLASRALVIIDAGDTATDFTHAQAADPTIFLQSGDATAVADYISLTHNQTDALISTGAGNLILQPAGETVEIGIAGAGVDYKIAVNGETNQGLCTYDEDNDIWAFTDNMTVGGTMGITGALTQTGAAAMASSLSVVAWTMPIDFSTFKIHDNNDALLVQTAADDDDLAMIQGAFGTVGTTIEGVDCGGLADTTQYAMFWVTIPEKYTAGATLTFSINAGMITTAADQSSTVDLECYVPDYANEDATVSSDLITTAAQAVTTTFANKSMVLDDDVTGYVLGAGDVVQCRLTALCDDDGNGGDGITIRINKMTLVSST